MKKLLAVLLTALLAVANAAVLVAASEQTEAVDVQRLTLEEKVEIPDVCVFSITAVELEAAEEEGFQKLSFELYFQNLTLEAVDLGEFLEYELTFRERFSFEITNPDNLSGNKVRPLVERTVTLEFELPNAALGGEHEELMLSLSFGESQPQQLDVLASLGLSIGTDGMDVPVIVLGRNMPVLTPGRWMNLGGFAVKLDAVYEFETIPNLPDDFELDESEGFLVTSLFIRNLSPEELNIKNLASAQVMFRERFIFEQLGQLLDKETLAPLEETMVYIAFVVPGIVLTSEDEEVWVTFLLGDIELTVEVRGIITEDEDSFAILTPHATPEPSPEPTPEPTPTPTPKPEGFSDTFLNTTRLNSAWRRDDGDTWRFDGANGYHLNGSTGWLVLSRSKNLPSSIHSDYTIEFQAKAESAGSYYDIAYIWLASNAENSLVDGFIFNTSGILYYYEKSSGGSLVIIGKFPEYEANSYVNINLHVFEGQVDVYVNNSFIQSRELTGVKPELAFRRDGRNYHIRNLKVTFN